MPVFLSSRVLPTQCMSCSLKVTTALPKCLEELFCFFNHTQSSSTPPPPPTDYPIPTACPPQDITDQSRAQYEVCHPWAFCILHIWWNRIVLKVPLFSFAVQIKWMGCLPAVLPRFCVKLKIELKDADEPAPSFSLSSSLPLHLSLQKWK